MKDIILLKLGGSLITDKTQPYTLRSDTIKHIASQIKHVLNKNPHMKLIIGNGSGSYGHYPAQKYGVEKGMHTQDQKMGFCLVQDSASRLNRIVIDELLKIGVKTCGLTPSSMIVTNNGKIVSFFIDPIIQLLHQGITPILHGDIVQDEITGSCILSTELILTELALKLKRKNVSVHKMIHCGLVKGVLDEKGNVVEVITKKNFKKIQSLFSKTEGFDVTGGINHKVMESLRLTRYGIKSIIVSGLPPKRLLEEALLGKNVEGTIIC